MSFPLMCKAGREDNLLCKMASTREDYKNPAPYLTILHYLKHFLPVQLPIFELARPKLFKAVERY